MRTTEPVHGLWYGAHLKKTACGTCRKPLLLFYCDCGCIVMVEGAGAEWRIHACRPGQNRFSVPDAFALGRAQDRRIDPAELDAGTAPAFRLVVEGKPFPPAEAWADGQTSPVRASFESVAP